MFDGKSRYLAAATYFLTDSRGRSVRVVSAPPDLSQRTLGIHVRREGERIDHLAGRYLSNPAGFWRIASHNHVVIVEALSEASEIDIPQR